MQEKIKSVSGKQAVLDEFFRIIDEAESYIFIIMEYFGAKWGDERMMREYYYPNFKKKLENSDKRGVDIRIIGGNLEITRKFEEIISEFPGEKRSLNYGGQEYDPIRFIVSDDHFCLLVTSKPYTEDLVHYNSLIFDNREISLHFKDYFLDLWNISRKWSEAV
ncbi:hypothetical protein AKJ57_00220 [candidate division MSBL1 archaeon SCGC-AAA259A05]|uniref:Uncharacterized protein n=1 Tax=candidate division MSBL1 archaeon SCGC-AAA259A05 TaxID=1698259 RepID=A0A133UC14_9EURY|nr:hypothetical protein AKJ57_00220 [candidate division MSBL1 archaeon SCGC-AAA259A05]